MKSQLFSGVILVTPAAETIVNHTKQNGLTFPYYFAKLKSMDNKSFLSIIERKVLTGKNLTPAQEKYLAGLSPTRKNIKTLFRLATFLRRKYHKDLVHTCSIINARSGYCPENCAFCAQSIYHKTKINRYPLVHPQEIVRAAQNAAKNRANCFGIVTSGRSISEREINVIVRAVREIVRRKIPVNVSASLGEISLKNLKKLKSAGLKRYHHNLETSPDFFTKFCTTHKFSDRLRTIKNARLAGLEVCCGGIFGLGESDRHRLELLRTLRRLRIKSVPLNFLNPVAGTRLGNRPKLSPRTALKWIALARIFLPESVIRVCGGREVVLKKYQNKIFLAGANGIMVGGYLTTVGRPVAEDIKMIRHEHMEIAKCFQS